MITHDASTAVRLLSSSIIRVRDRIRIRRQYVHGVLMLIVSLVANLLVNDVPSAQSDHKLLIA